MAKSQWSFKTAIELSAALAAKKVSAVELAQDAIGRIERHDGKINAICVRDFDRGLDAARAADAERARGETGAAARHPHDGEGILQRRRACRRPGAFRRRRISCRRRRAADLPRQGGRRRDPRQDQRAARARPTGRATTRSTAPPTTRSISAARPAAPPADRRRRWRRVTARCRSAPISAARCACRRFIAASMRTSRPSTSCRCAATRRRRCRRCRSTAISR